jgi:hypothetical protein
MVQERPAQVERRLSAILAGDVAGYSRLMQNDEDGTHAKPSTLLADALERMHRKRPKHDAGDEGERNVKCGGMNSRSTFPQQGTRVKVQASFRR